MSGQRGGTSERVKNHDEEAFKTACDYPASSPSNDEDGVPSFCLRSRLFCRPRDRGEIGPFSGRLNFSVVRPHSRNKRGEKKRRSTENLAEKTREKVEGPIQHGEGVVHDSPDLWATASMWPLSLTVRTKIRCGVGGTGMESGPEHVDWRDSCAFAAFTGSLLLLRYKIILCCSI